MNSWLFILQPTLNLRSGPSDGISSYLPPEIHWNLIYSLTHPYFANLPFFTFFIKVWKEPEPDTSDQLHRLLGWARLRDRCEARCPISLAERPQTGCEALFWTLQLLPVPPHWAWAVEGSQEGHPHPETMDTEAFKDTGTKSFIWFPGFLSVENRGASCYCCGPFFQLQWF